MTASGCEYFGSPDAGDAMGTLAAGDVYRALAASATEQGGCTWLQFEKDGRTCCVALRKDRVRLYTRAATADSAAGGASDFSAESAATSSAPRGAEGGGSVGGVSDFSAESASTSSAPRGAEGGGSAGEVLDFSAESASTLSAPRGAESGGALSMRMQQKRATAAVWENSSLILLEGEIGLELDADNNTIGQKIGNGLDVWSALPYSAGGGHVIQDSAGTELPKEGVLQFAGMEVTDDPAGGKTVVHGLGVKLADRAPVPGVPLHAVLKPVGIAPPVPPEGRADGTTITVDNETGVWSVAQAPKADRLATTRKIGEASFDGTADVTLAQMGTLPALSYSDKEIQTGETWCDGRPIYVRTIPVIIPNNTNTNFSTGATNVKECWVSAPSFFQNENIFLPLPYTHVQGFNYQVMVTCQIENGTLSVSLGTTGSSFGGKNGYVTVKYTKTTD